MEKRTIVDQIEITQDGTLQLRFAKQVIDDDGSVLSQSWHRTSVPPGGDIDAQMAVVNQHLVSSLKSAAVGADEITRCKTIAAAAWPPDVISAYQAAVVADQSAMAANQTPIEP